MTVMRLQTKFALLICLVLAGIGLLAAFGFQNLMRRELQAEMEKRGMVIASGLGDSLLQPLVYGEQLILRDRLRQVVSHYTDLDYAYVYGTGRGVIAHSFSAGFPQEIGALLKTRSGLSKSRVSYFDTENGQLTEIGVPLSRGGQTSVYIGINESSLRNRAASLRNEILLSTAGLIALAIFGSTLLSLRFTRPLDRLSTSLRRFGAGAELPELDISSDSLEVIELANAFREMVQARQAAERELQMAQFSIDKTAMAICWVHADASVSYVNEYASQLYGFEREELLAMTIFDIDQLITPENWKIQWARLQQEGVLVYETQHRHKNGHWLPVEVTCNYREYRGEGINFAYAVDISKRKQAEAEKTKLEERRRQSQKMEAIGTLAGGIAHDFNNVLAAILGYAGLALRQLPQGSKEEQHIQEVIKAGTRAKGLVQQILCFSRSSETAHIPLQMTTVVDEAVHLLRASIPADIELRLRPAAASGAVLGDPTQLHQIVLNLCTNAFHAVEKSGGVIEIGLENVQLTRPKLDMTTELSPGSYVKLSVSDNGPGIDPDLLERIFDPFFTTKGVDKGTGMGLAVVLGLVRSHQGSIQIDNRPGEGATFNVYLPRITLEVAKGSTPSAIPRGENERILVVDDEQSLADLTRARLELLGYQVVAVNDSLKALQLFQEQPERFDLVISDQTMPNLTGIQLAKRLLQLQPELPFLLCTGYSSKVDKKKARELGVQGFVMKPVDDLVLAAEIRRLLT